MKVPELFSGSLLGPTSPALLSQSCFPEVTSQGMSSSLQRAHKNLWVPSVSYNKRAAGRSSRKINSGPASPPLYLLIVYSVVVRSRWFSATGQNGKPDKNPLTFSFPPISHICLPHQSEILAESREEVLLVLTTKSLPVSTIFQDLEESYFSFP